MTPTSRSPTSPTAFAFPTPAEARRFATTPSSPIQPSPVLGARPFEAFPAAPVPRPQQARVTNPFNGRVMSPTAAIVAELARVGITIEDGVFRVTDPATLNDTAAAIRSGDMLVPEAWPMHLKQTLGNVLLRSRFTDAAKAVQTFIDTRARDRELARAAAGSIGDDDSPAALVAATSLTGDQQAAVELAKRGFSMFLSGAAGTGKTIALREIIRVLKNLQLAVAVTATTGLAATHINGYTFHHMYGVSRDGEFLRTKACNFDVLIIDEISMMTREMFENLDTTLRRERNSNEPFGGVQLILCGDFMQLEPVHNTTDRQPRRAPEALFTSPAFRSAVISVKLTEQVRLTDDGAFRDGVGHLRYGEATPELLDQVRVLESGAPVPPTTMRILPRNSDVRVANERRMELLPGAAVPFLPCPQPTMLYGTWSASYEIAGPFDPVTFADAVHAKMIVLAKGDVSRHRICAFRSNDVAVLRFKLPPHDTVRIADAQLFDEAVTATVAEAVFAATLLGKEERGDGLQPPETDALLQKQLHDNPMVQPLELKEGAEVMLRSNLNRNLVNGSVGTVVGFVKPLLENLPPSLRTIPHIRSALQLYADAPAHEADPLLPVVRFAGEAQDTVIPPWAFTVGGDAVSHWFVASAVCIPLVPAYAFTVHKTQGMTIHCPVHVELENMWACKHALYVLFTRVRKPEQLSLSGYDAKVVCADPAAAAFDRSITAVQDTRVAQDAPVAQWMFRNRRPAQTYRAKVGATSIATTLAQRPTAAGRAHRKKVRSMTRITQQLLAKSQAAADTPAVPAPKQPLRAEPSSQRAASPLSDIPLLLSKEASKETQEPRL